ncbi:hypothetical protein QAD02_023523 [Eretmocerus hayati]|uniref:Uncharacterized protein n=1 Tax=Eretmocerus hayati TaxID=131215 RepID=A0ACC2PVU1_9HYME|nr:hypothetical protein QAD02_023523 [Eretmocerus hayati]
MCSTTALMAMRGLVKETRTMKNAYLRNKIPTNVSNLLGAPEAPPYQPPCLDFIETCSIMFKKNNENAHKLFLMVLKKYYTAKMASPPQTNMVQYLNYTVLTATSLNGLSIIKMTGRIRRKLNCNVPKLVEYWCSDESVETWKRVMKFYDECLLKRAPTHTGLWCRLIKDQYYSKLAPKDNEDVMVFLSNMEAVFLKQPGIWNSWAMKDKKHSRVVIREYVIELFRYLNNYKVQGNRTQTMAVLLDKVVARGTYTSVPRIIPLNNEEFDEDM